LSGGGYAVTKTMQMESALQEILLKPTAAVEVYQKAESLGISERTVKIAKKNIGVVAKKQDGRWLWSLPTHEIE
jgi:hypothetical protein